MSALNGPVGVISNPASGHNRDQFPALRSRLENCAAVRHRVTGSMAEIRPALEEFAQLGVSVLAINGGDGTCSAVLGEMLESALFDPLPAVVLLPGGTANMNAGDVGVRGSLSRAVGRFCAWCEGPREPGGRQVRRALLRLQQQSGGGPRYGMFLGSGAVISGTDYAHRQLHARGLRDDFSLILGTLRTGWGLLRKDPEFHRPVALGLALDGGETQRYPALIVAMSTLRRLAFGMRPFWGEGPGAIQLTVIEVDCTRFGTTFASILRGHPNRNALPESGYHSFNAARVSLELEGVLNLDGEILSPQGVVEVSASRELEFLRL